MITSPTQRRNLVRGAIRRPYSSVRWGDGARTLMRDGQVVQEPCSMFQLVRMRTELHTPVPAPQPRLVDAETVVLHDLSGQLAKMMAEDVPATRPMRSVMPNAPVITEPTTARIIFGIPFGRG